MQVRIYHELQSYDGGGAQRLIIKRTIELPIAPFPEMRLILEKSCDESELVIGEVYIHLSEQAVCCQTSEPYNFGDNLKEMQKALKQFLKAGWSL